MEKKLTFRRNLFQLSHYYNYYSHSKQKKREYVLSKTRLVIISTVHISIVLNKAQQFNYTFQPICWYLCTSVIMHIHKCEKLSLVLVRFKFASLYW